MSVLHDAAELETRHGARGLRPAGPMPATPAQTVLALQRCAGNAAVARLLSRAPAASDETAGHQERSWARPAKVLAPDPVHVATIHFRTKESMLDAADQEVVTALAGAYSPYARRNITKPKEPQGLRGRVVGYADPRRSAGPDNQTLSEHRADATWRELVRHLVRASRVPEGHFEIERLGAGIAPEARGIADDEPAAEGNRLAPFRKAEIFLSGHGVEPTADLPTASDPNDKRVKPPNLDDWDKKGWEHTGWDRFDASIEAGDKREINAMAVRMATWTASGGEAIDETLKWAPVMIAVASGGRYDIPRIGLVKPPWWDGRGADLLPKLGRGGWTETEKLKHKAKLLKRDYIETAKWSEIHVTTPGSTYLQLIEEVKKDNPDRAKVDKWVLDLAYLRYMIDDVQSSSVALHRQTD